MAVGTTASQDHHYPSALRAWWIVSVLFCAAVMAGLDRTILGLTVDPIRADLGISDFQISLLQGLSFSLFYATAGIFCGYVSDRTSRKWLLVVGLMVWTSATIAGGFADGFWSLFASRVLVGLGEATLVPVAVSTISDLFPPDKRGRPVGIYLLGQVLAGGMSVMISGYILTASTKGTFAGLPVVGSLDGWRMVFIVCGAIGILVVALVSTIPDTARAGDAGGRQQRFSARQSIAFLHANGRIFVPLYLGYALGSITSYGLAAWVPMFLTRQFKLTAGQVGDSLGLAFLLAGPVATLLGGALVDRAASRSGVLGKTMLMIVMSVIMLSCALAPFTSEPMVAIGLVTICKLAYPMVSIAFLGVLQDLVPPPMRGISVSICGLTNAVIGASGGPVLIALSTQWIYGNPAMVGYSIPTVCGPTLVAAACCYAICRRSIRIHGSPAGA